MVNGRPNDERHFVHKKILGGISSVAGLASGIIPGASLVSGLAGRLAGRGRTPTAISSSVPGNFGAAFGGAFRARALAVTSAPALPACPEGFELDANGRCARTGLIGAAQRFVPGGKTGFAFAEPDEFGEATVGRFGAGLQPAVRSMETRVCPRGSVLGIDGLCYNKRDLANRDRFWPRGRRPLLTGGEMRCITVASRAASKIRTKTKQLQKMGMLPKATRRAPARRQLAAGHHAHVEHD